MRSLLLHLRLVCALPVLLIAGGVWYTVALLMLVIVWRVYPRRGGWIELSNIFAVYLFTPLLVLLPGAFWLRSWLLRLAAAVVAGLFVALFGKRFVPLLPAPRTQPRLRVATLNQLRENNDSAGTIAQVIAQHADVVLLQELSPDMACGLEQEQVYQHYPYRVLYPDEKFEGVGILSRIPLEAVERFADMRGMRAVVGVDGQRVTLLNVHPRRPTLQKQPLVAWSPLNWLHGLTYDTRRRDADLVRILDLARTIKGPLIVAGDFNTADREPMYRHIAALLRDAYGEAGWGLGHTYPHGHAHTWQRWMPPLRIDYIWSSSDVVPVKAWVNHRVKASDHCMLIADLVLDGKENAGQT